MVNQEGNSTNKSPMFIGRNYTFLKVRLRTYIMSLGANVWDAMHNGYTDPYILVNKDDKLELTYNSKKMNVILSGLPESMHCTTNNEIWDEMMSFYEGDSKVKKTKLQIYIMQFESLKMN